MNRIRQIQCGPTLCIPKAQDARPVRGHNSQWEYGSLSPYRRTHCGPCGRSTMRPPPTNHQSGDSNFEHHQKEFGAPHNRITRHAKSATSSPASTQAPSKQHSCHACTITHSRYHGHRRRCINESIDNAGNRQIPSYSFPLTFQDTALVQHPQKS